MTFLDDSIADDKIFCYDASKLIRRIYDDYIIYEYDGKPFLKIKRSIKHEASNTG